MDTCYFGGPASFSSGNCLFPDQCGSGRAINYVTLPSQPSHGKHSQDSPKMMGPGVGDKS